MQSIREATLPRSVSNGKVFLSGKASAGGNGAYPDCGLPYGPLARVDDLLEVQCLIGVSSGVF